MLANPIRQEELVRQGLVYAIDRGTINQRLFKCRQTVAHSGASPRDWVYNEDVKTYPYDPAKAAALLDAAGWTELQGGIRHNAEGEPMQREFMTTAGSRTREQVQQVLQSQWKQVDRKSTRLNSSHYCAYRMPYSA